jgi:D-glycero-D-manno-heptose 1,7-bisphosphate phosphatase
MAIKNRAIFIDKDGTLIPDVPYNVDPARISLYSDTGSSLAAWRKAGYKIIVISNQSGVAKGLFDKRELANVSNRLQELLQPYDAPIDDFYYCVHSRSGGCDCRKPQPGLLLQAASQHNIDLSRSWMIGDILHDVEAGNRAGCQTILVENGNETEWRLTKQRTPTHRVLNLAEATEVTK